MIKFPIYLDHNATTPCDSRVLDSFLPYFSKQFGNASSRHHTFGWEAEEAVEESRIQVARLIGAEPNSIVFTSGATESINLAMKGLWEPRSSDKNEIILSRTEHQAVLETALYLESMGAKIRYVEVEREGLVKSQDVEDLINPKTLFISLIFANNETGVIQPMREIGEIARKYGLPFFTDGTQAVGKIPLSVKELGIDLMAFSAHKLYGPKGVGALYINKGNTKFHLKTQLHGGNQEKGLRSGTFNVPGIVGFGKAAEISSMELDKEFKRLGDLKSQLENILLAIPGAEINGDREKRIPGTISLYLKGIDSEFFIQKINRELALSTGSACHSASIEPSHVLLAMGFDKKRAMGSLRIGLGRFTTLEEIEFAGKKITNTYLEEIHG